MGYWWDLMMNLVWDFHGGGCCAEFGGNGSTHVRMRGKDRKVTATCPEVFRIGTFRFPSKDAAVRALDCARATIQETAQGAFVSFDVPAIKRDRPNVDLPYEIHIYPAPHGGTDVCVS